MAADRHASSAVPAVRRPVSRPAITSRMPALHPATVHCGTIGLSAAAWCVPAVAPLPIISLGEVALCSSTWIDPSCRAT